MSTMLYIWAAAVIIFLILEIMTPSLVFACFVGGAVGSCIVAYIAPDAILWQIAVFAITSLILLPLTRSLARKITKPAPQKSNVDALIDKVGLVTKAIDPDLGGQVKIGGEIWVALADEAIGEGEKVIITSVSGAKLHVTKKQ